MFKFLSKGPNTGRQLGTKESKIFGIELTLKNILAEGGDLHDTLASGDGLDEPEGSYSLFSNAICISSFHLSNPREIVPRIGDELCKS